MSQDWRGGVRRTAVDALARLFTGCVRLDLRVALGGLARDSVLKCLVVACRSGLVLLRRGVHRGPGCGGQTVGGAHPVGHLP